MNARQKCWWSLGLLFVVVSFAGCQQNKTAEVEGKVTYQGKPFPRGTVVIQDSAGNLHTANLNAAGDGTFHVVGVGLGPIKVAVQVPQHLLDQAAAVESLKEAKEADAPEGEALREAEIPSDYVMPIPIPEKYSSIETSGLEYELTSEASSWKLLVELE